MIYATGNDEQSVGWYLVLKRDSSGQWIKKPADAITEIFNSPDLWSMDCYQFANAASMYAYKEHVGDKTFNEIASRIAGTQEGQFRFGQDLSPVLPVSEEWSLEGENVVHTVSRGIKYGSAATMDEVANAAPVGSLYTFRNRDKRAEGKAFEHENAILVDTAESDGKSERRFVAFGIPDPSHPFDAHPAVVTETMIRETLAKSADPDYASKGRKEREQYLGNNIYVKTITTFAY